MRSRRETTVSNDVKDESDSSDNTENPDEPTSTSDSISRLERHTLGVGDTRTTCIIGFYYGYITWADLLTLTLFGT